MRQQSTLRLCITSSLACGWISFLSGWTGGPDLYTPRYGNAFLRARHLPFAIGTSARDQWLTCMVLAMQECEISEDKQDILLEAFFRTADWMRNKPDN